MQNLPSLKGSSKYEYPCDGVTATLILNKMGSYDDIMNMSFEGAIKTYACIVISNKEAEEWHQKKS